MGEFRMPSLGADMEAGTLVEWRVKAGDAVRRGEVVAVVETDKGAIEVEIWEEGVVEQIRVAPGEKVPVGTVLATLRGTAGAVAPAPATTPAAAPTAAAPPPPARAAAPSPPAAPPSGVPGARARASPAARARARELGVDLAAVPGTGPGGAVTLEDVARAASASPPAPAPAGPGAPAPGPSTAPAPAPAAPPAAVPAPRASGAGIRQAIAAAMARSKREIPHYYLSTELDLSLALAWLARENERRPVTERILPVAVLLKATARAAREVPEVNGFFVDGAFRPAPAVHLGIGISLRGGGLIAPALHDVDAKPLEAIMRELADLVARARSGGLRSSELSDPTLTVTSLGDLGVASVFGVIYPPQVAIVGFGRIGERPLAVGGKVEARPAVVATLSGDHRASDGIRGARFLAELEKLVRRPEAL